MFVMHMQIFMTKIMMMIMDPQMFFQATSSTEAKDMSGLLEELGKVVTKVLAWVIEAVNTITSSPFILICSGVLMLGAAIGILGRLLSRR